MPALLRRHQAAGPGTATWLPALFFFPAGGCETWSQRQTRSWKSRGVRPQARAAPPPQPARLPQPGARAPPSTRPPGCLLPPPRPLSRSLARSLPRAGSPLTPPHAAAAAGRWRGTTAARCWMKSSRPSSSTISLTRRYCQLGTQARDEGAEPRGAAAAAAEEKERSGGRTGAIGGGVQAAEPPLSTCRALRSVTGVASCRSPAHAVALGGTVRAT